LLTVHTVQGCRLSLLQGRRSAVVLAHAIHWTLLQGWNSTERRDGFHLCILSYSHQPVKTFILQYPPFSCICFKFLQHSKIL
jgi:hypothetical protein